jgi:hypothetical protein
MSDRTFDHVFQMLDIDWIAEKGDCTQVCGMRSGGSSVMGRRMKYDWNGFCARVGLELLADAEPGRIRQIDVEQDGIGTVFNG